MTQTFRIMVTYRKQAVAKSQSGPPFPVCARTDFIAPAFYHVFEGGIFIKPAVF